MNKRIRKKKAKQQWMRWRQLIETSLEEVRTKRRLLYAWYVEECGAPNGETLEGFLAWLQTCTVYSDV